MYRNEFEGYVTVEILTSSLMTVALLRDRSADVILRPKSARTILLRLFNLYVNKRKNYITDEVHNLVIEQSLSKFCQRTIVIHSGSDIKLNKIFICICLKL